MDDLKIEVENCNSIDYARISLRIGALNIKYGPNGLGKSTIAKAIVAEVLKNNALAELVPFKCRGKVGSPKPKVSGVSDLKSALVFDEAYVNQFAFQQDEVVKNSFNIFINTPEYEKATADIEDSFVGIKKAFSANPAVEQTLSDLKELRDAFGAANKDGTIPKSSKLIKAYGRGNKVENIPEILKPFELFIKGNEPSKWIGWQVKGNEFLALGEKCPYCASELPEGPQKQAALAVATEYDATSINHLNTLKAVIERLGKYFSEKCRENIEKITKAKIELSAQEKGFLSSLRTDIESLISKLEALRTMSFFSLRDVGEIGPRIEGLKIDLSMMEKIESDETKAIVDPVNEQLDALIKEIGVLKGKIGVHKSRIKKAIEKNQASINAFLKSAGYKYAVVITPEPDTYKMKLVHHDMNGHIESASKFLSYGEKNAFALVLFMHQVISENPDLVVLDDPISSFDKNKKFAILHQLFRGGAGLKGRTTLFLTHDIEPAIDIIKGAPKIFEGAQPQASFLSSRLGVVSENQILRDDIKTFVQICRETHIAEVDPLIKAIYLRREYEILDDLGFEYNLLASLFKKRIVPTISTKLEARDMSFGEKEGAEKNVRERIPDFNYDDLVKVANDNGEMLKKYKATSVGYEKIQIFRIIRGKHEDDVIRKFINESYHIENEYVMQLSPRKFESVPEYVVNECDRVLMEGS